MYVAHVKSGWSKHHVYIGRPTVSRKGSALANPFRLERNSPDGRAACLQKYRAWLYTRLQAGDAAVWQALRDLRPYSVLVDYVQPLASHGHVIMRAWEWAVRQGLLSPEPHRYTQASICQAVAHHNQQELAKMAVRPPPAAHAARRLTKEERRTVKARRARDLAAAEKSLAQIETTTVA